MSDGDWFSMYTTHIELGLRFPLPEFLLKLLRYFGIALTQLCPNAVQEVLAFIVLCFLQQVECQVELFLYLYDLRTAVGLEGFITSTKGINQWKDFSAALSPVMDPGSAYSFS